MDRERSGRRALTQKENKYNPCGENQIMTVLVHFLYNSTGKQSQPKQVEASRKSDVERGYSLQVLYSMKMQSNPPKNRAHLKETNVLHEPKNVKVPWFQSNHFIKK